MTQTNGCHADHATKLRHISFTFDNTSADDSALHLVHALSEEWRGDDSQISFVRFTEGITNTLTKAVRKRPGQTDAQADESAVLIRAYGNGTDVLIDRERELRAHTLLASLNLAPPLLARFDNGLIYAFVQGSVCSPEELRLPRIYRAIAQRLGEWHATLPITAIAQPAQPNGIPRNNHTDTATDNEDPPALSIWTVMRQWIKALPVKTAEQRRRVSSLTQELAWLYHELDDTPGLEGHKYVFGHCDLLSGNVIVRPPGKGDDASAECSVDFIDYEYATPAPAAFDIANHFAEWVGFKCDYSAIPTRSARKNFLQAYVASFRSHLPSPSHVDNVTGQASASQLEKDVAELDHQVNLFRGVPGFYWGIWSLIQAQISQIDFDYASYADLRLGEYWAWKAEHDGSRAREKGELSVRERRWAQE